MKGKLIIYGVMLCAIITGSTYAIYLQKTDIAFFELLYNGLLTNYKQNISVQLLGTFLLEYIKKIGLVIFLSSFHALLPIGIGVVFLMIFSYSFTTSCFVILYGIQGLGLSFVLWGIQSIIMTMLSLKILCHSIEKKKNDVLPKVSKGRQTAIITIALLSMVICDLISILQISTINSYPFKL